jgi:toxin ParE1/3/4
MARRVILSSLARHDLAQIGDYIARRSPRSAQRFLDAAHAAFTTLVNLPALGGAWESADADLANLRVIPVTGFTTYLIFYFPGDQEIEVVRILHGARDVESLLRQD